MLPGSITVEAGGEPLVLLPGRAAWWPRGRSLMVADVHLGKAASFRRLGVPVPPGTTGETLAALGRAVAATGAERLVVLGDLVHSAQGLTAPVREAVAEWRRGHASLAVTLVRGNHDARSGELPADWRVETVAGELRVAPGLLLAHEPATRPDAWVLAGHLHPCVTLHGRANDRLRLPCFHFGAEAGVMPAFGAFTGMHPVRPREGDRLYVVAEGAVHAAHGAPAITVASR